MICICYHKRNRYGDDKRCYNGNHFQSGYSDHLPVLIKLDRK